jgi:eukaryotic-like serine/threonine-protein kinase
MPSLTRSTRRDSAAPHGESRGFLALDRYRLHRPLGAGGFGTVWLARDERLDRDVAVKVLPRERIVGGRFEREARAAARLSHPGIVTLYEAAVDDEGAYLVSELVRGSTLAQLLEAGRLSDRDILEIGIALCDALEHAHRQGVVHRDVKPSNVLVPDQASSPAQVAKLTDFGVARVVGGDSLTRTGDVIGTAAYMAPEQAEGREAGAPADLYSLALVLYEGLTGVNPIATGSAAQRARRLGAHLPPLRRQRRELPRQLGQAIDLALRPRPRERGTLKELRIGLQASLSEVEDEPGLVDGAWPEPPRSLGRLRDNLTGRDGPGQAAWRADQGATAVDPAAEPLSDAYAPRSQRLLAGAAAGLLAGWLAGDAVVRSPLAPLAAAVAAGIFVAALPRIGWLALVIGATGTLVIDGRAGAAAVLLPVAFLPIVLLPRRSTLWPVAALAPALGAIGLAGAWPALAARGAGPWRRAALGGLGWIWLLAAALLGGRGLYTELPAGIPSTSSSMASLGQMTHHVLFPMLTPAWLAPAAVWALGAVLLAVIRVRSPGLRIVLVVIWSAVLASSTSSLLRGGDGGLVLRPNALVVGAVAGAIVALAPELLIRWRGRGGSSANPTGLA